MCVTSVLIFFSSKEYDSVLLHCCQLNVIGLHYITFHRLFLFFNTCKKSEKKTREEIEEQKSTETEILNKGRLTVQFVLLRLQLESQYSLVYMQGDSFGEVQQGHTRKGAIKQGSKVFLGSLFRNGPGGGVLQEFLVRDVPLGPWSPKPIPTN